jgi:hypothetical protein
MVPQGGGLSYYSAFEIKQLSKREKLKSKRDLNEIIKNVKIMEIVWTYNFLSYRVSSLFVAGIYGKGVNC